MPPDVFNAFWETRAQQHQEGRPADDWMLTILAPEARLLKFDTWMRQQLWQRLKWPGDARQKTKLVEQCRIKLERLVLDLWRRRLASRWSTPREAHPGRPG